MKLGIRVSPRTVGEYLKWGNPWGSSGQRSTTFVRNHAQAIVACDFFVSVTSSFRVLYVFIPTEIGSRRILHCNVTEHPTAEWTIQQFREFLAYDDRYWFVSHDRDTIFSSYLDSELQGLGVRVLKTPVMVPKANAYCERLVGTVRRECIDFLIPAGEAHLKRILRECVRRYNRGRAHTPH
jgi:putative transposase